MGSRHLLTVALVLCGAASAQEVPDMVGSWSVVVSGLEPHPQCGESVQQGVLVVERKITPRAYRGKIRSESSYKDCEGVAVSNSGATVRIKGDNLITIDYDEDGWEMDRLRFADGVLTGDNGKGVSTRWERVVGDAEAAAPDERQLADLDALLEDLEPQVSSTISEHYYDMIVKAIVRTGELPREEARQVTGEMVTRMTTCMIDDLRELAVNGVIPIEQIMQQGNVVLMFDPSADEFLGDECVENAGLNAGIRLR